MIRSSIGHAIASSDRTEFPLARETSGTAHVKPMTWQKTKNPAIARSWTFQLWRRDAPKVFMMYHHFSL